MKTAARALSMLVLAAVLTFAARAMAQQKCDGPADMCVQILQLRQDLAVQKAAAAKAGADEAVMAAQQEHRKALSAKLMGISAVIAVALKLLISAAKGWIGFLKTDKGKAAIKATLVVFGFLAFILTNIGAGIDWWQALIIAGGPPGAIVVHELSDLFPVIWGKKKLPPDGPSDPPDQAGGSPALA